jgi:DNA invertase Pin-like site-specific DNA recombinase
MAGGSRTADGYIRVSRRGGREGESFISPEVQRQKIAKWAELHDVEIVQWWEEIDESGAKLERPMFQEALERCERGETGGIVVARLDRFARSAIDALESIKRLNGAGARLVSVEDNFDGSTPMGRFAIGILSLLAELELERIRENWEAAKREAIRRGVHIASTTPTGYKRNESGRLVPDEPAASIIAEAFRKRALGTSWTGLAELLEASKVFPASGNKHWSKSAVRKLIQNPVYLGQARSGEIVNDHAHEPIVTRAEFDAAQSSRTLLTPRDGSLAAQALLGGLIRCAGCGHTLKIAGHLTPSTRGRYPFYYCTGRYASGPCPARASIRAEAADHYVEQEILAALQTEGGLVAEARAANEQLDQASRAVTDAEHELDLFVLDPKLLSLLGEQKFREGVEVRQRALDNAHTDLAHARSQATLITDLPAGDLVETWPTLTTEEKRRLLHGLLDRVVLARSPGRGKNATPVQDRTQIVLRGGALLEPSREPGPSKEVGG